MDDRSIYNDIATRTQGDIYIGVVGPVRTGKSTFIKRFMDSLVIPNIDDRSKRDRAIDELPQSAAGRTIMTTEPKFVPESGVRISFEENAEANIRLIDCVGYIVPSALGYIENESPRMVKTPWSDEEIPFSEAAEIGTRKVITEHSTIGLVVTTDGSISDIPREEYEQAEQRVINELKTINKPFAVLLNCTEPAGEQAKGMCRVLIQKYGVPVLPVNCLEINERQIRAILAHVLFEFPVKEINIELPSWVSSLNKDHWLRSALTNSIKSSAANVAKMRQIEAAADSISNGEYVESAAAVSYDLGNGGCVIRVNLDDGLFYRVISEGAGFEIENEGQLMRSILELSQIKQRYDKIKAALSETQATGYGIVMPTIEEMELEKPQIIKQSGRFGVKLRATAPSIHMMRADIAAEVTPMIGNEKQSEEFLQSLLDDFESDPHAVWSTDLLGKSLHEMISDGLHSKLYNI
ncbi:MAG: stage IV sporulation protein A, partial [Clostridia bacterium]|nr:stage IV sporulation protein A [Clostridia bacterium]